METVDSLKKQLVQVNRDIEGMLLAGAPTEKAQKVLKDACEYRASLEEDLLMAVRKDSNDKGDTDEPAIIGVIVIGLS